MGPHGSGQPTRTRRLNVVFTSWWQDGEVGCIINGIHYTYHLDAAHFPQLQRMARYSPGKALSEIKRLAYTVERKVCY